MKFHSFILFVLLLCFVFPLMSNADQLEDAKEAFKNEDFIVAKRILSPLAEKGDADAQSMLGAMYANGQGGDQDLTKGLSWIMKAANQGHEVARMNAFRLCMDLGNQGDTAAMFNVGYMCLKGWGGEYDNDTCLGWMETAGKQGHVKSIKTLAKIYGKGLLGVTPNEEKAASWNKIAEVYDAGIDGKWEVSVPMGPGGTPMKTLYDFKADGNTLTGTITGQDGEANSISRGKIEGNNFSFVVNTKFFGRSSTQKYAGVFLGDTLQLTQTTEMNRQRGSGKRTSSTGGETPPQIFNAKRVK